MPAPGLHAIRYALASRMSAALPGVAITPFLPDSVASAPCIWIEPDRPFINYERVFEIGRVEYRLMLTILTNRLDSESSQINLDAFLDPGGDLITTLHSGDIEDDLSELVSYVTVLQANRYGAYSVGGTTYLGAQLIIAVS